MENTISTLPHELLGEVFKQCASICSDAPIVLGAVSRLFRHIVYTTPLVWTRLKLDAGIGSRKPALWFSMSKACDVDVQIDMARMGRPGYKTDVSETVVDVSTVLATLRLYTDRVASLYLRADTQVQACAALAAVYSEIPPTCIALRSLHLKVAKAGGSGPPPAFPAIPTITDLEITNVALFALPNLNLDNLRNLRIVQPLLSTPIAVDDVLNVVRFAPCLQQLAVEARIADPTATTRDNTSFMPQLGELHLRVNNLVALLDRFVIPALRVLHLRDLDGKRANASEEIGAALHRLLARTELRKGSSGLRVFELAGVKLEGSIATWEMRTENENAGDIEG